MSFQKASFAAGCFWGVEQIFFQTLGVTETAVGYTQGATENPSYKEVCSGTTGHVEAIEITYDDERVSFEKLLEVFWNCHDATQVGGQGPDMGSQYRSGIYCYTEEQLAVAQKSKEELAVKLPRPIATEIMPATIFYMGEEYHQKYLQKNRGASCSHT
ncbi:MAG: peptide-methionine (S)-S-oxide reductase MsrA [SAR324 cluster bacterium]|nr:peptide-methionine (S)-S-oxide reductase MsrA [SAR324 cluster bacterium]